MKIIKVGEYKKNGRYRVIVRDIMVDDSDYDWLREYKWVIKNGYAATKVGRHYSFMHRMIMGVLPKEDVIVDHIDNNKHNNQRSNLRVCNRYQNQQNRKTNKNNTLPKGVRRLPSGRYNVRVQAFGERYIVGTFDSLEEAIAERNRVAKHMHGEFMNPAHPV